MYPHCHTQCRLPLAHTITYWRDAHLDIYHRCTVERVETAIERVHDEQAKTSQLLAALVKGLAFQQPSSNPPPFGVSSEDGSLDCTFRVPVKQQDDNCLTSTQSTGKPLKMTRRKPQVSTSTKLEAEAELEQPMQVYAKKSTALCKSWCSCACHTKSVVRVKQPSLVGSFSLAYSGLPWITAKCSEKACRSRSVPSVAVTVQFPAWFWKRYLSTSFCYTNLRGPEVNIKVPRIVDWTSGIWGLGLRGNIVAIQEMFSAGTASPWDVQGLGGSLLHYATDHGHWELCKFLASQGATLDNEDDFRNTPTSLAWEKLLSGSLTAKEECIVTSVFDNTDYLQTRQFTILHKIVLHLIPRDLDSELAYSTKDLDAIDASGRTSLSWAAARGDETALNTLLAYGADVNLPDSSGNTPLHLVKTVACCSILLVSGANVNARNSFGHTALHSVCRGTPSLPLLKRLLAADIDIDVCDASNETALSNATYGRHIDAALYLLDQGARMDLANGPSAKNDAPIHMAVLSNVPQVLGELLKRGAPYTRTTDYGQTILHIAARLGELATVETMERHGLRGIDAELRDCEGKTARDYLEEREEENSNAEFRAAFEALLDDIEARKECDDIVEIDFASATRSLTRALAAVDLGKDTMVSVSTPLCSDDEEGVEEFEDIYPEHGAPMFFDALEEVYEAPRVIEILV